MASQAKGMGIMIARDYPKHPGNKYLLYLRETGDRQTALSKVAGDMGVDENVARRKLKEGGKYSWY